MGSVGGPEILVILVLALVLLGPERLPAAARTLGKWVGELRKLTGALQAEMEGVVGEVMSPLTSTMEPVRTVASWAVDQPAGAATAGLADTSPAVATDVPLPELQLPHAGTGVAGLPIDASLN